MKKPKYIKFYIRPTEEHPNNDGVYELIRSGTLTVSIDEKSFSKDLSQVSEDATEVEFEIDESISSKSFYVSLSNDEYESSPTNPTHICPIILQECSHKFRFAKKEQGNALIGIIKAYKMNTDGEFSIDNNPAFNKNVNINNCNSTKNTCSITSNTNTKAIIPDDHGKYDISMPNSQEEIYTIDIEQTIRLNAFVYEKQKIYKNSGIIINGNITKTLANLNDVKEEDIAWAFKVVNGTYLASGNNTRSEATPTLGDKQTINISKKQLLSSIPDGYVEIEDKQGSSIGISLKDIFNESLLDSSNEDNIINKNIIFFAYCHSPTYKIINNTNDRVTSIELNIVESRFRLEFDGKTLAFLENERIINEWEARSGSPIKDTETTAIIDKATKQQTTTTKEKLSTDRLKVKYTPTTTDTTTTTTTDTTDATTTTTTTDTKSFYYDTDKQGGEKQALAENTYYIGLNSTILNQFNINDTNTLKSYKLTIDTDTNNTNIDLDADSSTNDNTTTNNTTTNNTTTNKIYQGDITNDDKGICFNDENDFIAFLTLLKTYIQVSDNTTYHLPLHIKYQKRILITIDRYKQTLESTKARMNIYLDGKRVDSNGVIIQNTNNTNNPYAYILERPGPDSIAGEVKLRIPEGRYDVEWHTVCKKDTDNKTCKKTNGNIEYNTSDPKHNTLNLTNNYVGSSRAILIHNGNSPKDTAGCLLINSNEKINNKEVPNAFNGAKKDELADAINTANGFIRKYIFGTNETNATEVVKHIEIKVINTFKG